MTSLKMGLIGCGYFGSGLARLLNDIDGVEVVAVHGGSRASELSEELQCTWEEQLESLMQRADVSAVIVASPSHAHRDAVLLAAQYGKHVFCEKPVALTLADCEQMLQACRDAGVLFMVGHIMHFMEGIRTTKRLIAEGRIGQPLVAHAERTGWEEAQEAVSWKKNNALSGGHLFHHVHDLDLIQMIMGPATSVVTAGGNLAHQGEGFGDEEDVLLLTLALSGGGLATMQYGSGFRWGEHFIRLSGTKGAIRLDFKRAKLELKEGHTFTVFPLYAAGADEQIAEANAQRDMGVAYGTASSKLPEYLVRMMADELACFVNAVRGEEVAAEFQHLFDGTSARSSIATAEAALQSMHEKKWIAIEP